MEFRIADTFTASLGKLSGNEQKAAKTAAFDLQMNPAGSGKSFHKLTGAKDKDFWSVRVSRDVRLIVHKTDASLLLCYVDHHDDAYAWASRRKIERHPKTGAAQLVEIRETVRDVTVANYVADETGDAGREAGPAGSKPSEGLLTPVLEHLSDDDLLSYGVPHEWLSDARSATEDSILELAAVLPAEAGEALLVLATGGTPEPVAATGPEVDPFDHPDAQRRFRLVANSDELQRALDYPWDRWAVFLHPSQRAIVERTATGPTRVTGSAGTGKTVVALHRAVHLARQYPESQVLLTTFSVMLARSLRAKLRRLTAGDAGLESRLAVRAIDHVCEEMYEASWGKARVATPTMIRQLIANARTRVTDCAFSDDFLFAEWTEVVDGWQLENWSQYRDISRAGRGNRLGEKQRAVVWEVFEMIDRGLREGGLITLPRLFAESTKQMIAGEASAPADYVVVDEAQDIAVYQLRFLAALAGSRDDGLFFAGDLGQRIFQTPFSWKTLGVDIRGRSHTLKVNYRTSHQIRSMADRLLESESGDIDGNVQDRSGTVSAFSGPEPKVMVLESSESEQAAVVDWLRDRMDQGMEPHELAVFVRSENELRRAHAAITAARLRPGLLSGKSEPDEGKVALGIMHDAKGLEFRGVAVMACDDDVIPSPDRLGAAANTAETETVYDTERHLLYVACTRARDHLLITGVSPVSEFLDDFG